MAPGDQRPAWQHAAQARQILNDAEDDLREWQPGESVALDPVSVSSSGGYAVEGGAEDGEELARYVTAATSTPAQSAGRRTPVSGSGSPTTASVNAAWKQSQSQSQVQDNTRPVA